MTTEFRRPSNESSSHNPDSRLYFKVKPLMNDPPISSTFHSSDIEFFSIEFMETIGVEGGTEKCISK